jgi:preprotein translocase subunit SecD
LPINSSIQQITTTELKDLFNQQNLSVDKIHVTSEKTTITHGNKADIKSINSLLYNKLNNDYLIEVSRINSLPSWLESLNAKPIKLGLDLSGGVLFVLDIDTKQVLFDRFKNIALAIKTLAMEARIRGVNVVQSKAICCSISTKPFCQLS